MSHPELHPGNADRDRRRTRADLITLITEAQAQAEEAKAQRESITPLLSAITAMCVVALLLGFYLGGK